MQEWKLSSFRAENLHLFELSSRQNVSWFNYSPDHVVLVLLFNPSRFNPAITPERIFNKSRFVSQNGGFICSETDLAKDLNAQVLWLPFFH